MTTRTTQKVVRFLSAFSLPGFDAPQPAGEYLVDHDEEQIEVASRLPGDASPPSSICRRSLQRGRRSRWCRSFLRTSMPHSKRTTSNHDRCRLHPPYSPPDPPRGPHASLYGRPVCPSQGRLWNTGLWADIYRIIATLPPRGNSPQYRIRDYDERHERVATQDTLEPVRTLPAGNDATLIERTFGHGQGTETQQSRDQKAETGKGTAETGKHVRQPDQTRRKANTSRSKG